MSTLRAAITSAVILARGCSLRYAALILNAHDGQSKDCTAGMSSLSQHICQKCCWLRLPVDLSLQDAGVQEDRQDVQKAVDEMQHPTEGRVQAVMLRRMQLVQADPLFVYDLAGSVRGALQLACQRHSQQELLEVRASAHAVSGIP